MTNTFEKERCNYFDRNNNKAVGTRAGRQRKYNYFVILNL